MERNLRELTLDRMLEIGIVHFYERDVDYDKMMKWYEDMSIDIELDVYLSREQELSNMIEAIELEEKKYFDSLDPIEQKLLTYHNQSSIPKATLLFNAIKEGVFDDMKNKALIELKNIMINENSWKETSNAKNPEKDKNYQRTLQVINLMKN